MDFNNDNSFNPNMNPYFTLTLFDSDNSNLAMNNMNQQYMPSWDYPTQYDPYLQSYNQDFQNNFDSSQSPWGFNSPESNFQLPCPQFCSIHNHSHIKLHILLF